jgi:hypothetical protein
MNDATIPLTWASATLIVVVAAVLGAALAFAAQWAYDQANEPTSIDNTLQADGDEPTLDDAIHEAAEEAVQVEGGKFKGKTFKVARIELTADNPHITAYRVILETG